MSKLTQMFRSKLNCYLMQQDVHIVQTDLTMKQGEIGILVDDENVVDKCI